MGFRPLSRVGSSWRKAGFAVAGCACYFVLKPDSIVRDADMKPSEALASNRAAIRQVVESHRARNARVFGSVLHGQDTDSSDLDILVDPTPETGSPRFQCNK